MALNLDKNTNVRMGMDQKSVGLVETKTHTFAKPPNELLLECGRKLGPITIAYETYGKLNDKKSNTILILHALSGDAHAAGYHSYDEEKAGWWDIMIGPGKAFDTNKYFVICSNILGGCKGTTGPMSINPESQKPFGMSFPMITVSDMVNVQKELIDHLGIKKVLCLSGGSLGGMQALQWTISYPDWVEAVIPIATTSRLSAQSLAFNAVGRNAIISDPDWNNGEYFPGKTPAQGLAIARMIGHITYLSPESMHDKFGRRLQEKEQYSYDFVTDFQVESYLHYQGIQFVERFDANTYLYFTKAMDYFDLAGKFGSLERAFEKIKSKYLVISFTSDWLFPAYQSREIVRALIKNGVDVSLCEIKTPYGHDAFLLENEQLTRLISSFLSNLKLKEK